MPRVCTICAHDQRPAIDGALVGGEALRGIARTFRVSDDALARHKADHLPTALVKAQEAEDVGHAIDIVKQLKLINQATLSVLKEARDRGNHDTQLKAVDRVQKQIELQAKLIGELDERPQINVLLAPEWLAVRAALFVALAPYPEARQAVAARLVALESS